MLFYLRSLITVGAFGVCAVFLMGCGQQGPLYLPVTTLPAAVSTPSDVTPDPKCNAVDACKPQ